MIIQDFFKIIRVPGEVGIEVEVEGDRLPVENLNRWKIMRDGSLRGNSGEYVLRNPVAREEVKQVVSSLWEAFERRGSRRYKSDRTSCHVHINVQQMNMVHVFNFIILYLMYEELLVNLCGDSRVGNLFCLRMKDAEGLLYNLGMAARDPMYIRNLRTDDLRYASINLKALGDYGSLEFRALRGTLQQEVLEEWIDILLHLKDAASRFKNPIAMVEQTSGIGMTAFTEEVFKRHSEVILSQANWEDSVLDSMRQLQMVAYKGDWDSLYFQDEPGDDI